MKKQLLILLVSALILTLFAGCGGGTDSTIPAINQGDTAENSETPQIPGNTEGGTFTLTLNVPGSSISSEKISGSVVPWTGKTLMVTITGEFITAPMISSTEVSPGGTYTATINNVPIGLNTASIEILDENSNIVAQRKYGFFMYSGGIVTAGTIYLGVAIEDTGMCNPPQIEIPTGTTLYFENQDYNNARTASLEGGTISTGAIPQAEHSSGLDSPEVFHTASYTFDTPGDYVYDAGQGGDGTDSYKIFVYDLPVLDSISPEWISTTSEAQVDFTLSGNYFGPSQAEVEGEVNLFKLNYSWENAGSPGFSDGSIVCPSLSTCNGTAYLAYIDGGNSNNAVVKKFNGTSWETVGPGPMSSGAVGSLSTFVYDNKLYVAYEDLHNDGKLSVRMFNGSSWRTVGTTGVSEGDIGSPSIYVVNSSSIYVAFIDKDRGYEATVMKYDGSSWSNVGERAFSDCRTSYVNLSVYSGELCVSYRDRDDTYSRGSAMKYDGSSWSYMGGQYFSTGGADYPAMYVYDDVPYIAYADEANASRLTVKKFNGSSWEPVGAYAFTPEAARYISIDVYGEIPYVAYRDDGNGSCAGVMKYDGSSWVSVDAPGLSDTIVGHIDIDVYDGKPYIAFIDAHQDSKVTCRSLTDLKTEGTYNLSIDSWSDSTVTGSATLPGGLYRVELRSRRSSTDDNIYFDKGRGSYNIIINKSL